MEVTFYLIYYYWLQLWYLQGIGVPGLPSYSMTCPKLQSWGVTSIKSLYPAPSFAFIIAAANIFSLLFRTRCLVQIIHWFLAYWSSLHPFWKQTSHLQSFLPLILRLAQAASFITHLAVQWVHIWACLNSDTLWWRAEVNILWLITLSYLSQGRKRKKIQ